MARGDELRWESCSACGQGPVDEGLKHGAAQAGTRRRNHRMHLGLHAKLWGVRLNIWDREHTRV